MFYYAPLFVQIIREDSQERTYHLCAPVAKPGTLKNAKGEPVSNPAALVVYGLRKVKEGSIVKALVRGRGEGVYDFVQPDQHAELLQLLDVEKITDLPLVAVREFESAEDENGELKTVRYGRKVGRRGRRGRNTDLSNEVTTVSTQTTLGTEIPVVVDAEKPA